MGLFFRDWAWPVEQGALIASTCQGMMGNSMLPNYGNNLWMVPLSYASVQSKVHKDIGVGNLTGQQTLRTIY